MRPMVRAFGHLGAVGLICAAGVRLALADTLFLEGRMGGRIQIEVTERYDPAPGTRFISVKSPRTPSFSSPTWQQRLMSETVSYSVQPSRANEARDDSGNVVVTERWDHPSDRIEIVRKIIVQSEATLSPVTSRAAFPLTAVPPETVRFLRATSMTQRDDPRIQELARRLTADARTEWQAVTAILNHVVDNLKYQYDPPGHDALTALGGVVNCQGYSHLSLALLRAAGVPARFAVGISLSKGWRIRHADGSVTFKMGQGRHAWIEVFYPDIGWVPYDPQSSHLFVSIYHVRQAVGLDVNDVAGSIVGSPNLPGMHESIAGDGAEETFGLATVRQSKFPRNYVVSSSVKDAPLVVVPPPPVTPPPPPPAQSVRRQDLTKLVEFGNLDFPASLRIFTAAEAADGGAAQRAARTFVVETADYATGRDELAQAFRTDGPIVVSQISLAMQKFGGQTGEIWLELFADKDRKPGARLGESRRIPVSALLARGGYRWVIFDVAPDTHGTLLQPGRYWAVLRSTGDGIFNWYFSPGNAYGEPDDSRSSARGVGDWSNILNYRLNFRVTGLTKP